MQNVGEAIDVLNPWGVDVASESKLDRGKRSGKGAGVCKGSPRNADRKAS